MAMINNQKELTRGDTGLYTITLYDSDGSEYIPDEREAGPKIVAGTGISLSYSNGTLTISLAS